MFRNLLTLTLILGVFSLKAQYSGVWQTSNNAGVREAQLNPSSISDSRLSFQFHLASAYWVGSSKTLSSQLIPHSLANLSLGSDKTYRSSYSDISGPGIMAQGENNHAFVLGTRIRAWQNDNEVLTDYFNVKTPLKTTFKDQNYTSTVLQDISFGYALPIFTKDAHSLKMGAALKFYKTITQESYTFSATDSTLNFVGNTLEIPKSYTVNDIFGNANGKGYDIGFTYEYRPKFNDYYYKMDNKDRYDVEKTKYALKFSLSLLDLGGYSFASTTQQSINTIPVPTTTTNPFQNKSIQTIVSDFNADFKPDDSIREQVKLPSTLVAHLDLHLGKSWYVNTLYRSASIKNAYSQPTVVALAIRSESVNGSWSMPVSYDLDNKKVALGFHARTGSLFFGTDNVLAFGGLATDKPAIYVGMSISIRAKRIKDDDNDKVSNALDKCPKEPGIWQFRGCADSDEDGIPDKDDLCRYEPGPASTHGCKDTDGDGVPDKEDRCKTQKGSPSNNGCPLEEIKKRTNTTDDDE